MYFLPFLVSTLPWFTDTTLGSTPVAASGIAALNVPAVEDPPLQKCTGSIAVGAMITDGDSDTRQLNATADASYRREGDRTSAGFWWNYTQSKNATPSITQRKVGGFVKYDYFLDKKTFVWGKAGTEYDLAQDIDTRTTIGAGVGRQFFENEAWIGPGTWNLQGEAGLAWVDEKFRVNTSNDDNYISARLAYKAQYTPNTSWNFTQDCEVLPSLEDSSDVFVRLDTRAKATLTEKMFAQLRWYWTYDNTPSTGANRTNDTYELSIGWSF